MARGRQVPPEANEQGRALGIVLFGGLLVSIVINGSYTRYVRPGIGPLLLGAGAILVLVGLSHFLARPGPRPDAPTASDSTTGLTRVEHGSSGHRHLSARTTWLLLVPSVILLLAPPPPLGATSVSHYAELPGSAAPVPNRHYPPLAAGGTPAIGLNEFVSRADFDVDRSVSRRPVTITGFVAGPGPRFPGGYLLVRFVLFCCAADAHPAAVHVNGYPPLPIDTWVTARVQSIDGSATAANGYVPEVRLLSLRSSPEPSDPYKH